MEKKQNNNKKNQKKQKQKQEAKGKNQRKKSNVHQAGKAKAAGNNAGEIFSNSQKFEFFIFAPKSGGCVGGWKRLFGNGPLSRDFKNF